MTLHQSKFSPELTLSCFTQNSGTIVHASPRTLRYTTLHHPTLQENGWETATRRPAALQRLAVFADLQVYRRWVQYMNVYVVVDIFTLPNFSAYSIPASLFTLKSAADKQSTVNLVRYGTYATILPQLSQPAARRRKDLATATELSSSCSIFHYQN